MAAILGFMHATADIWSFLTAIGTIAMAFTTGMVVRQTKHQITSSDRLIKDTERQIQQSERQHQDSYKPVLVLVPQNPSLFPGRLNELLSTSLERGAVYEVAGVVENIGAGIAMDITLSFWFPGFNDYVTVPVQIPPIASKASFGSAAGGLRTRFYATLEGSFNEQTFRQTPSDSWKIVIEYKDIFNNFFFTTHNKSPLLPWTEFSSGRFSLSRR